MNNSHFGSHSPIVSSLRHLSHSQYQETKNIPCPNPVRRVEHDQPSSLHMMKPKMDPSHQIYHYANLNNNNTSNFTSQNYNQQIKSPIQSRHATPTRTPLRSVNQSISQTNYQSNSYNQNNSQVHQNIDNIDNLNNNMSQLLERVDNLEHQFEQEKRQSRYVSNSKSELEKAKRSRNGNNMSGFLSANATNDEYQINPNDESQQIRYLESEVKNLKNERIITKKQHETEVRSLRNDMNLLQSQVDEIKTGRNQRVANDDKENVYRLIELEKVNQEKLAQLLGQRDQEILHLKQVINQQSNDFTFKLNEVNNRNVEYQKLIAELQKKSSDINNISQQVEYLNEQIRKKNQEIQVQKQNGIQQEDQIKMLQKMNDTLKNNTDNNQKVRELQQHCLVLANELEKMNPLITQKNSEIETLTNIAELKKKENQNMKNENIILMEKIGNQTNQIKQLEKDLYEQGIKMKSYSEELDKLQSAFSSQSCDTARVNEKIVKDNGQLQNNISELKIQINRYEAEQIRITGINQQLTTHIQQCEIRIKELEMNDNQIFDLQRQIKDLQNQISLKNNEISLKDSTIKQLNDKVSDIDQKNRIKLEEITQQYQVLLRDSDKSKEVQTLQSELIELKNGQKKFIEDNTKLAFELDQLAKNQQVEINKQLDQQDKNQKTQFMKEKEQYMKEREQYMKDREQSMKEKEQLLQQINQIRNQLQIELEKNRELQSEMSLNEQVKKSKYAQNEDQLKRENESLETQIQKLNGEKNDIDQRKRTLEKEKNELINALKQSDNIIQQLQKQIDEQQKSSFKSDQEWQNLDEQKQRAEVQRQRAENEKGQLKEERDLLSQQIAQLNRNIQFSEQEKKRLHQDLEYKLDELKKLQQRQREKENELNSKINDLQIAFESSRRENQDIDDLVIEHNAERTSFETHIIKLKSQLNEQEQLITQLTSENKILQQQGVERLNMIENWKKQYLNQSNQPGSYEDHSKKLQKLEESLLKEKHLRDALQNQLVKYEQDLKNKELEVTELYQLLERRKSEHNNQKSVVEDIKKQNDSLRERIKQVEAENIIKTEYHDRSLLENDELHKQVQFYKEQLKNIEENLQVKGREIDDNLNEVRQLKSRYEEVIQESRSNHNLSPYRNQKKENQKNSFLHNDNNSSQPFVSNKSSFYENQGKLNILSNQNLNDVSVSNTPKSGSFAYTTPKNTIQPINIPNIPTINVNNTEGNVNAYTPGTNAIQDLNYNSPFTANLNLEIQRFQFNTHTPHEVKSQMNMFDQPNREIVGGTTRNAPINNSSVVETRQRYNTSYEPSHPQNNNKAAPVNPIINTIEGTSVYTPSTNTVRGQNTSNNFAVNQNNEYTQNQQFPSAYEIRNPQSMFDQPNREIVGGTTRHAPSSNLQAVESRQRYYSSYEPSQMQNNNNSINNQNIPNIPISAIQTTEVYNVYTPSNNNLTPRQSVYTPAKSVHTPANSVHTQANNNNYTQNNAITPANSVYTPGRSVYSQGPSAYTPGANTIKDQNSGIPFTPNQNNEVQQNQYSSSHISETRNPQSVFDQKNREIVGGTTKSHTNSYLLAGEQRQRYNSSYEPSQMNFNNYSNNQFNNNNYKLQ